MANSQFTIYSSTDPNGPGYLTGISGSLITIFDACLVNGYSGKTSAGWSKPFADTGSRASYKPPSGSRCTLLINDGSPNATPAGREAWATGWETLSSNGGPCGTGSGQFPLPAQLLTSGHVVIRKSTSADSVLRPWVMFADAYTMYFFSYTSDAPNSINPYYMFVFGDIYSLAGTADAWRCILIGRDSENYGLQLNEDILNPSINLTLSAHYMPRTANGGYKGSLNVGKFADASKTGFDTRSNYQIGVGGISCPNPTDNLLYLSPVWISEANAFIRGRMRGLYSSVHPFVSFADGQILYGNGPYAGKTFKVLRPSPNIGVYIMEISNTVETN